MVRTLYRALVGGGHVQAVDFWNLRPGECWWILSDKIELARAARGDGMTNSDKQELYQILQEAKAQDGKPGL